MERLELTKYGVEAVNTKETRKINGGVITGQFLNSKVMSFTIGFVKGFFTCFVSEVLEEE